MSLTLLTRSVAVVAATLLGVVLAGGPAGAAPAPAALMPVVFSRDSGSPADLTPAMKAGVWPTDAPHIVLRPFEAPATRYSAGHRGIDIAAVPGQPVYAVEGGTVSFAGVVVDRPLVSITHGDGLLSSVEPVTPTVAVGQPVVAGQQIGVLAGSSTHCELGCLHLGLRLHGEYVSPLLVLGGIPRAVLLPLWGDSG